MEGFYQAISTLAEPLRTTLRRVPVACGKRVQEIRLWKNRPVSLSAAGERWFVCNDGSDCCYDTNNALICRPEWIDESFDIACERSVYAHQEEVRNGYVTTRDGVRIGIAGTAVVQHHDVTGYRSISSLCIRVSREHPGCSNQLLSLVRQGDRIHSVLLCGEPASGKSTVLRDAICSLSRLGFPVAVVDERGELQKAASTAYCDVLLGTPKATGIEQAVRCLAPRVVVFDELGDRDEVLAVVDGIRRGVPVMATAHATSPRELLSRDPIQMALKRGAFDYVVFLKGRNQPGEIGTCHKAEELLHERFGTVIDGGDRSGGGASAMVNVI